MPQASSGTRHITYRVLSEERLRPFCRLKKSLIPRRSLITAALISRSSMMLTVPIQYRVVVVFAKIHQRYCSVNVTNSPIHSERLIIMAAEGYNRMIYRRYRTAWPCVGLPIRGGVLEFIWDTTHAGREPAGLRMHKGISSLFIIRNRCTMDFQSGGRLIDIKSPKAWHSRIRLRQ